MFGEKGFYCLCITCCVIGLSGVNGFGVFIVCVFIVCSVVGNRYPESHVRWSGVPSFSICVCLNKGSSRGRAVY